MMIAAMGVPGCGKTTTFKSLAYKYNLPVYLEKEEDGVTRDWFTRLQWFRSQRVPKWKEARENKATDVLVDSCYDLLLSGYIDKPSLRWLIPKDSTYYWLERAIAREDWDTLPQPDCIVFFHIDYESWLVNLVNRGRACDQPMITNFSGLQYDMYTATTKYCYTRGVKLIDLPLSRVTTTPEELLAKLLGF